MRRCRVYCARARTHFYGIFHFCYHTCNAQLRAQLAAAAVVSYVYLINYYDVYFMTFCFIREFVLIVQSFFFLPHSKCVNALLSFEKKGKRLFDLECSLFYTLEHTRFILLLLLFCCSFSLYHWLCCRHSRTHTDTVIQLNCTSSMNTNKIHFSVE